MIRASFAVGEYYHIFNRGVEKRNIFLDQRDFDRFLESMLVFNTTEPIGGIYAHSFMKQVSQKPAKRLIHIICYCLNPNHFHMILEEVADGGVSEFLRRLGGYTKYFNHKYKRNGVLLQGRCKIVHIETNEQLLHTSAYVNCNDRAHGLRHCMSKSSWDEYIGKTTDALCEKKIILDQFASKAEYRDFTENSLKNILERKEKHGELEKILLE